MQTLLFTKVIEITPHISFECEVDGQTLTAVVTHRENTGVQVLYHVHFSDGHFDAYAPADYEVQEGFGRTRKLDVYEEAVFEDLCVIPGLEKGNGYCYIRVKEEGGESFNVWIKKRKGYYNVYYKGQYQFTLRKGTIWEINSLNRNGYVVNGQLARLVSRYLDQYKSRQSSRKQLTGS
jgi:hypothetical protein